MKQGQTSSAYIPVIDLARARRGCLAEVGEALDAAFARVGVCYVVNHGLSDTSIAALESEALDFFHLPLDEKLKSKPKEAARGFNAIGSTRMQHAAAPDYKEYFQIGLDLPRDDPAVRAGQGLRGPNQWPTGRPGFRRAFTRYFDEVAICGRTLLSALAAFRGAGPDFFVTKYDKPLQRTQALFYPPQPEAREGELYGIAPHTDYGGVTLLWQDDAGGLEVKDRSGRWIYAPPLAGGLIVNVGDLLQQWFNDRYLAPEHRVTNRSGRERLAVATFYDPDYAAVVDPRELCIRSGEAPLYPPVVAGQYIMGRIHASQNHVTPP